MKRCYFQIQSISLICSFDEIKVIKSKVALERRLSFQKQKYAINSEPKKNCQSKIFAQINLVKLRKRDF